MPIRGKGYDLDTKTPECPCPVFNSTRPVETMIKRDNEGLEAISPYNCPEGKCGILSSAEWDYAVIIGALFLSIFNYFEKLLLTVIPVYRLLLCIPVPAYITDTFIVKIKGLPCNGQCTPYTSLHPTLHLIRYFHVKMFSSLYPSEYRL